YRNPGPGLPPRPRSGTAPRPARQTRWRRCRCHSSRIFFPSASSPYSTRLATEVPIGFVPEPLQLIFSRELPVKVTLSAMIWVQLVLALLPPAYSRLAAGVYTAPPNTWLSPPLNFRVVLLVMLRSPNIAIPAVPPVVGPVIARVAPPLMVASA